MKFLIDVFPLDNGDTIWDYQIIVTDRHSREYIKAIDHGCTFTKEEAKDTAEAHCRIIAKDRVEAQRRKSVSETYEYEVAA